LHSKIPADAAVACAHKTAPLRSERTAEVGQGEHKTGVEGAVLPPELWTYADNPDAALIHDASLRKGDIVITPSGIKVSIGPRGKQHAAGEFELVSRSSAVDRRTRKLLAAMVAPSGALPADEARKLMATLQRPSNHTDVAAVQLIQTAGLRVV
jgi:hypothetical protein